MRICLTSTAYPPETNGGIPRQRQILANALARLGHDVHVIIQGERHKTTSHRGVTVHSVPSAGRALRFSAAHPALDERLAHSLAIQEQARLLNHERALDVLDAPLWALEGLAPIQAGEMPVVLWLQTSFAQLVGMGQGAADPDAEAVIGLERECLRRAPGIIADSATVLADFAQLYGLPGLRERAGVVHLGLPDLPARLRGAARADAWIEALLVGRLEKRKGIQELLPQLPVLLRAEPRLRVRFVGADNSRWDGFFEQHGQTYPEYFSRRWPELRERVIFEGAVSERRLIEAYRQASLMLVPTLYESFGLIYLEAMRAGLPVVTYASGAAPEIFPRGERDGALIAAPHDPAAFPQAVLAMAQDEKLRAALGAGGRARFVDTFLDTRMAEATVEYYRKVAATAQPARPPRRIFQVMEAPVPGDAVSAIALRNAGLLREMGAGGTVLHQFPHTALSGLSRPIQQFNSASNTAIIFHHWNYSNLVEFARQFPGPKAIHYHNITPPEFFSPGSPGYEATSRGYAQLPELLNLFDLLIGDSAYNIAACQPFLRRAMPSIVLPPLVDAGEIRARPHDAALLAQLRAQPGPKLLFVGRIARNKRQDRLIDLLAALRNQPGGAPVLYLVGGSEGDPAFRAELEDQTRRLRLERQVVFAGKVPDAALSSYYRAADLFVSASEHEGFGLPLIEAMALDLPVLAFAAGAVPETLGQSGLLLQVWDSAAVAEHARRLAEDPALREQARAGQRQNLRRFAPEAIRRRLAAVVRFLRTGEVDPEYIVPAN